MTTVSPMSEQFHDWLEQCPVQWFRTKVNYQDKTATYLFSDDEE